MTPCMESSTKAQADLQYLPQHQASEGGSVPKGGKVIGEAVEMLSAFSVILFRVKCVWKFALLLTGQTLEVLLYRSL